MDNKKPKCNATLPFEPGPACNRPVGHTGDHISVGGLWRWPQKVKNG